ncbi:hypothetical protein [Ktedonobacter robiniae]|uniref:Uncharacterized protein n=1 Tax=Ktedonobacter robiniae TaxID=2778365 RepID=A0ABQ3V4R6_9CHLR|nr:hypothetical protein [Ktedonobacter robiniae]GHO59585.1 hypothetical protein KSB_80600 [Ktedonobacter robiniae]
MSKQGHKKERGDIQRRPSHAEIDSQRQQTPDDSTMPETNDAGDAISEDSLYDASGAATGGGVDTPTAVEESTEKAVRKHHPINQGSSSYTGGGSDNGSNL